MNVEYSNRKGNELMKLDSKIFVAGGSGLVGSAIIKNLLITPPIKITIN